MNLARRRDEANGASTPHSDARTAIRPRPSFTRTRDSHSRACTSPTARPSSSLGFAPSFQLLGFVVAAWTAFAGVCVAAPFDRPAMTAIVAATGVMSCAAGISAARIQIDITNT